MKTKQSLLMRAHSKAGVALLLVISALALLLLMAVTFSTLMRTEYLAASTYSRGAVVRGLTGAALTQALEDIEFISRNKVVYDQDIIGSVNTRVTLAPPPAPPAPVPGTDNPRDSSMFIDMADSLSSGRRNYSEELYADYIPSQFTNAMYTLATSTAIEWIPIHTELPTAGSPTPAVNQIVQSTNVVGRYAYIAYNATGLIDINQYWDMENSNTFTVLPEFKTARVGEIKPLFQTRFETLEGLAPRVELFCEIGESLSRAYAGSSVFSTDFSNAGAKKMRPLNLWHHSLEPAKGERWDGMPGGFINPPVKTTGIGSSDVLNLKSYFNLDLTPAEVAAGATQGHLINVFENGLGITNNAPAFPGNPATAAEITMLAMDDYYDADSTPSDPDFGTEIAPMFNEFLFKGDDYVAPTGAAAPYTHEATFDFQYETWYTFASNYQGVAFSQDIELDVELHVKDGMSPDEVLSAPSPFTMPALPATGITVSRDVSQGYFVHSGSEDFRFGGSQIKTPTSVELVVKIATSKLELKQGGQVVDRVGGTTEIRLDISTGDTTVHYECNDPRFNFNLDDDPAQWQVAAGPTLNGFNTLAQQTLSSPHTDDMTAFHVYMHVANKPMTQVGELGWLPYAPWKTLRTYDYGVPPGDTSPVFHNVWNYFEMPATNSIARGRFNVNTIEQDVLAFAIKSSPIDLYPGQVNPPNSPDPSEVTDIKARDLASAFLSTAQPANGVVNRGDIFTDKVGVFRQHSTQKDFGDVGYNQEWQRESIVRNFMHKAGTRDNNYGLFMMVQAGFMETGNNDFFVTGAEKTYSTIWRDGWKSTDANSPHNIFIRSTKVIRF